MTRHDLFVTRREMLSRCGMGMGAVALTSLLGDVGSLQAAPATNQSANPLAPKAATAARKGEARRASVS